MQGAAEHSNPSGKCSADADLFSSPSDLCCPITLEPFLDPVLTAAGQVYERTAIERHYDQPAQQKVHTDPVTGACAVLRTVFVEVCTRSRLTACRRQGAQPSPDPSLPPQISYGLVAWPVLR